MRRFLQEALESNMKVNRLIAAVLLGVLATAAAAQDHHGGMNHAGTTAKPIEAGQDAFGAIAEIVELLSMDPTTDWTSVDIEALREHLIDMNNVTLRSAIAVEPLTGGATFRVSSPDPVVTASIQRMTLAHAAAMDGSGGWKMATSTTPEGAELTVTGDEAQIRALGFIGVMTLGMHHQAHHLAVAKGTDPHD
jgi:hypothetical protein